MEALVFVTSNNGKGKRAKGQFQEKGLDIEWYVHDCIEPEINDIEYISRYKAVEAYGIVNRPCFVFDSGFYIDNYPGEPGFPGAFPKRIINNDQDGIAKLLEKMEPVSDRKCRFVDYLTYYDGNEFKGFYGVSEGTLAYEKRGISHEISYSDLWYVFIPRNCDKTLAEMTDEERDTREDGRTSAKVDFINWYKAEMLGYPKKRMPR